MEDFSIKRKIEIVKNNYKNIGYDIRRPFSLSVENFQDITQDIGKSAYKFNKVIERFKQARDSLFYPETYPVVSYLNQFIKVDDFILKRIAKPKN